MSSPAIFIKSIVQKDKEAFTITWSDGKSQDFFLAKLQAHCPCAECQRINELSQEKQGMQGNVRAYSIESVGRYAIRIRFTSGCSQGIYDFGRLRALGMD